MLIADDAVRIVTVRCTRSPLSTSRHGLYRVVQLHKGPAGELPGAPLFVVTHEIPGQVPAADPPYTFVTDGIASAIRQALGAAAGRDGRVMGASIIQQRLRGGLLDELTVELVPLMLATAFACSTAWKRGPRTWKSLAC
jgi:dihydrofolate reductase